MSDRRAVHSPAGWNEAGAALSSREEIPEKYKWQTSEIYVSEEAWEADFQKLKRQLNDIETFRGKLGESSGDLLKALQTRDNTELLIEKLYFYAHLKSDEDTRDTRYQALLDRVSSLTVEFQQKSAFLQPEILALPDQKIHAFLKENEALKIYSHYLEDLLRTREHVLSAEGEQILALSGEMSRTPYQVFSMFNNADIKFPLIRNEIGKEVELTKGNFSVFMRSPDRRVRRDAFSAMYEKYAEWKNTLAAGLGGAVKKNIFYAKARKYPDALHASLDADNIPVTVYDNVLNTLNKNLQPMHRYIGLRKKVLELDEVHPWDLYVPLVKELEWKVGYDEAVDIIEKALHPLGDDYLSAMRKGFSGGWLDVYETPGKRSGAYSSSVYAAPHPYMLLNYNHLLDDMFTVAHEMGHSMHSYFTMKNQPYIYSNYTIFVAEVASTLNEALLMDYLLKTVEDHKKQLYLLNQYIDQIRGTVYIQALFAEFEKSIHEKQEQGEALTVEVFNELSREIYTRYYGDAFAMDSLYEYNWTRIPHFYYNFYVFQYATGMSAATALSRKILAGDANARDAYLHFLGRGNSEYSIRLLKDAGVDMTTPDPIEATTDLFARLLDRMENLIIEQE